MEFDSLESVQSLFDNTGLLDILVSFEEYLDSMDLFVFDEWINGEVLVGPIVSKYWVEITLKYKAENPPDPRGALLFKNSGCKIQTKFDIEKKPINIPLTMDEYRQEDDILKPKMQKIPVLLVKFTVPRKLLDPGSSTEYQIVDAENMTSMIAAPEGDE